MTAIMIKIKIDIIFVLSFNLIHFFITAALQYYAQFQLILLIIFYYKNGVAN